MKYWVKDYRYWGLLFTFCAFTLQGQMDYKAHSELSEGDWYKFKITQAGIYALSFEELKDLGIKDPFNVGVYGQSGGFLNLVHTNDAPYDIEEIPAYFDLGNNNAFDAGDRMYFFLNGPNKWEYNATSGEYIHQVNSFSFHSYYFLGESKKSKSVSKVNNSTGTITNTVNTFDNYNYHELDTVNLIQTGKEWFGESYGSSKTSEIFKFNFPNLDKSVPVKITSSVVSRSSSTCSFAFENNGDLIGSISIGNVNINDQTGNYARKGLFSGSFNALNDNLDIKLSYVPANSSSDGYLDYIRLHARCKLIKGNGLLLFRDAASLGESNISKFVVQNMSSGDFIWNVTDVHNPLMMSDNNAGADFEFITETNILKQFVAFSLKDYLKPILKGTDVGKIENQDLHGVSPVDYVIVTHKNFEKYANELAQFHRDHSGLSVLVVDQEKVFNEFSSGTRDVAAVRNFMKMLYDRSGGTRPRYLLLFGDGTYDNKRMNENNENFILTYESDESLRATNSYVTDDFYGILDSAEHAIKGSLDVGIGRFPVSDTIQARTMVRKVKLYMSNETFGDWRNNLCFIGDDEDRSLHMTQSNDLSDMVYSKYPWFNRNKIFLDAYKQVSSAVGARYPDVNKSIFNQMEKGTLLVNYTGHGAEFGLAHERILSNDDIKNWNNWGKFPVFMTATCEFSRFDYVKINNKGEYEKLKTTGEYVVTYPKGGAVASFTTTRIVYSSSNEDLNINFFKYVFENDTLYNERYRLGDIIKRSKIDTKFNDENKRKFTLLGDPALLLAFPKHKIIIDSINGKDINSVTDTMGALAYVSVVGHVEKISGGMYNDFNGIVSTTIYDKAEKITTLDNDREDELFEFELQNNVLFKGKASVENGTFKISFILPKDISYLTGKGRISCYAFNDETDATGWDSTLIIGGFNNAQELNDNMGPEIEMYLGNYYFKENGTTNESPLLIADLYDESGINTSTSGLGHEMVAIIDNNFSSPVVMNDFYASEVNSFKKGIINFPLLNLEPGEHIISIKVWDVLNNSSEDQLSFVVKESDNLVLSNVFNYPNPLSTYTNFVIEHNQSNEELEITIQIFSSSGNLIRILNGNGSYNGFMSPVIEWDGRAENGSYVENGLYFYRVTVKSAYGMAEKTSKMLIVR